MEPSKEAIAVRLTRLNRQILGKITNNAQSFNKKAIDREALLDALTVLYDECNEDCVKKGDELIRGFLDKYRSSLAELRRTRVCISDFEMLQLIGRGHFGDVHMVREKHTGDVYALKTLRKESALSRRGIACYDEERDVLAAGAAPWLVKLQYAFQDASNLYLVMELCSGGDLAGLLARQTDPLSERDAAFYVAEVAHALRALHGLGYVHRDIKPQNILLDRCGHVKLCDFGSAIRLSEGGAGGAGEAAAVGTADYVAPELLAAAACAGRHSVCLQYCRGLVPTAISACDYWSLGVVAFELVTLRRPFSGGEGSVAETLSNIQRHERLEAAPPFAAPPAAPGAAWRALVAGLLAARPARRFHYLDTLQHAALRHLAPHSIRDQAPPWVPSVRGPEDASHFPRVRREPAPPDALPFRTKTPFGAQLPFIGFSFVAPEENEDTAIGFNASHDCTAIDLATYKSAEKLAAMRAREVAALQQRLAEAEARAAGAAGRERACADRDAARAALQQELADLALANRRLERELETEKEERRIIEKNSTELLQSTKERTSSELKAAYTRSQELEIENSTVKEELRRLESRVLELQAEAERAAATAEAARVQQEHYKDSVAKERALRRQTLSGREGEAARLAAAEAAAAGEARARGAAEAERARALHDAAAARLELADLAARLHELQNANSEKQSRNEALLEEMKDLRSQLAQEKTRTTTLKIKIEELERAAAEAAEREAALEEQRVRTEARLAHRLEEADARAVAALHSDARHRDRVNTLEQLVRQLEREVNALEARSAESSGESKRDGAISDTESVSGTENNATEAAAHAQVALLKEQLEKMETMLQARTEEIATLKQETRAANLAKWRKEKELSEQATDAKSLSRDVKRLEERLAAAAEARRAAELRAGALRAELETLRPELETLRRDHAALEDRHAAVAKADEALRVEVDRSRNDIRKLKSELQYSERRRVHAETQAECAARERARLRDEAAELRHDNTHLVQNNKALQETCSLLEEQLTDLEKLADLHEVKNKELETETRRMREEVASCRARLLEAERAAAEGRAAAQLAADHHLHTQDAADNARAQIQMLRERLASREARVEELEARAAAEEGARRAGEARAAAAARRLRDLHEECAELRTRTAALHRAHLELQARLADAQEEIAAGREAADAAAAWWRTRETKADATLRQQAKLIDFLQVKVEEANRKKCSIGNKLFGSKGRRVAPSPPLRKANRELREEVERLRARLAATDTSSYESTPKKKPTKSLNGALSIDTPDSAHNTSTSQLLWPAGPGSRAGSERADSESCYAVYVDGEDGGKRAPAAAVAVARSASAAAAYAPPALAALRAAPLAALVLADDAIAIGCTDGLHSQHGPVRLEWEESEAEAGAGAVTAAAACAPAGRALLVRGGALLHTSLNTLASALRRAATLRPHVKVRRVRLPDGAVVGLVQELTGDGEDAECAAVACGRRVLLLRWDAAAAELRVARALAVERPPDALLLTPAHLYVAAEGPLRAALPAGALEPLAAADATVAAAAARRSPPRALLLVRAAPVEILVCYAECGVFVDERGERTRGADAEWPTSVRAWRYVRPFLYLVADDGVVVGHLDEDSYRPPPCTCDDRSLASSASASTECGAPRTHTVRVAAPALLGAAAGAVLVGAAAAGGYEVLRVDGRAALRGAGASVESLESACSRRASEDGAAPAAARLGPSGAGAGAGAEETGFLADIRKRAAQLRNKARAEDDDEAIKEILTAEVGPRSGLGRKSPATLSEFSSDSEGERARAAGGGGAGGGAAGEAGADAFARQVRFQ